MKNKYGNGIMPSARNPRSVVAQGVPRRWYIDPPKRGNTAAKTHRENTAAPRAEAP
jgi:hypothetical protein